MNEYAMLALQIVFFSCVISGWLQIADLLPRSWRNLQGFLIIAASIVPGIIAIALIARYPPLILGAVVILSFLAGFGSRRR